MQPLQEHFHPIFYPLWILSRYYHTFRRPYFLQCIYQYHLQIPTLYSYLHTHILIVNRQFLLLIEVPIQDCTGPLSIYKIFTLDIPHGNYTARYNVNTQYLGVTQDETMAVEVSQHQFSICQAANGQVCNIYAPLQPLANPPSCITAFYAKNTANISNKCSLQIRKTHSISIPSPIAPNVWILTSAPSTVTTAITLIYPGETTKFLTVKKPIHIL